MPIMQHAQTCRLGHRDMTPFFKWLEQYGKLTSGLLIGSYARGDNDFRSDLDIALEATPEFDANQFEQDLNAFWGTDLLMMNYMRRKLSFTIFLTDLKKIDLLVSTNRNDLIRNIKGSRIPKKNIKEIVLFDKKGDFSFFLAELFSTELTPCSTDTITELIHTFMVKFEACSRLHAKSDAYRFYFNYNIALHIAIQLRYIAKGNNSFVYSPRNYTYKALDKASAPEFYSLKGTFQLPEANTKKHQLLDFFYASVELLLPEKLQATKQFCEQVFKRDYFWNFRDHAIHSSLLKSGVLFRSSSLSLLPNSDKVIQHLDKNQVTDIIDLRASREVEEFPYSQEITERYNYIHAPFDPWNQPEWFQKNHQQGDNRTIAYRFFLMACQTSFKQSLQTILRSKGSVVLHCFAGKDRTGLFIGALQLLLGVNENRIIADYMASGSDADEHYFRMLFDEVNRHGGIETFLVYQGINPEEIQQLQQKLKT